MSKWRFGVCGLRNGVCGLKEQRFSWYGWREWRFGVGEGKRGGLNINR